MQKMKKRKGFTLTELAIVIAVIAILIAVLVPTFVSLINSAKLSADEQAVKNMNTALATSEATDGKPSNLVEAKKVLAEAGYKEDLEPTTSGYFYYWNSEYNIVMLIDVSDSSWELIYPTTSDAGTAYSAYKSSCFNLNARETTGTEDTILAIAEVGGTIYVKSADDETNNFYAFSHIVELANLYGESFAGATVVLQENIGSDESGYSTDPVLNFQGTFDGNSKTITIAAGGITPVYGEDGNGYLFDEMYEGGSDKGAYDQYYAYGLFASVTNGGAVKNLTVDYNDTTGTNPESKRTYFGGIAGFLGGDSTISGCTITGDIVQYNRVGGVVGTGVSGTIENCTVTADITSCKVSDSDATYSYAAGIVAIAIAEFSTDVNNIYVKNCVIGPDSGRMNITTDAYAGGVTARITLGITEFNITDTTVQNVTITSNLATSNIGAVCGGLYVENCMTGNVTIKGVVNVQNYAASNWSDVLYVNQYDSTNGTDTSTYLKKPKGNAGTYANSLSDEIIKGGVLVIVGYYRKTISGTENTYTFYNTSNDKKAVTYYDYTSFKVTYPYNSSLNQTTTSG